MLAQENKRALMRRKRREVPPLQMNVLIKAFIGEMPLTEKA